MENIDIAPFYKGQEVIANCDHHQGIFKKGEEFKITNICKSSCCGCWVVTIGIRNSSYFKNCSCCSKIDIPSHNDIEWEFLASRFSPKIKIEEFISLKEVSEKALELISAN